MFFLKKISAFFVNTIALLFLCKLAKISIKMLLKNIRAIMPIVLFSSMINIFLVPGDVAFKIFGISITWQGIYTVIFMTLRVICLFVGIVIFCIYTTSNTVLINAIERCLKPLKFFKISPSEVAIMLSIAIKFIPILFTETEKIMNAQKSRGAKFDTGNFKEKIEAYITIIVPLLVAVFKRADDLAIAMESRCYCDAENRTKFRELRYRKIDFYATLIFIAYIFILFLINKLV